MRTAADPLGSYLNVLRRAAPVILKTLEKELGLSRRAAAEAFAVTAAVVPCGLARHTRRRPEDSWAAMGIVKKHGRPADLGAPELGIGGRLARKRLSPRLGSFLGQAGARAAAWAARRGGASPEDAGRALAALAPIVLGALDRALPPGDLADWVAMLPDDALTSPDALLGSQGVPAEIYRSLSRLGRPWPVRLLGLE